MSWTIKDIGIVRGPRSGATSARVAGGETTIWTGGLKFDLTSLPPSTRRAASRHGSFASGASSSGSWGDRHLYASVHRLDRAHQCLQPDVSALTRFKLGNDRLPHAQFRGELTLRQSAGIAQGHKFLFNVHRLQFRLDGGGEIRVVFRAPID